MASIRADLHNSKDGLDSMRDACYDGCMGTKTKANKYDVVNAEQSLRDSERHCGRDPDNMLGVHYRNNIRDNLASDGFDVSDLTDAVIDASCDFPRE